MASFTRRFSLSFLVPVVLDFDLQGSRCYDRRKKTEKLQSIYFYIISNAYIFVVEGRVFTFFIQNILRLYRCLHVWMFVFWGFHLPNNYFPTVVCWRIWIGDVSTSSWFLRHGVGEYSEKWPRSVLCSAFWCLICKRSTAILSHIQFIYYSFQYFIYGSIY